MFAAKLKITIMIKLQDEYEKIVRKYVRTFCKKEDVEFDWWVADRIGGVGSFGDLFLDFDTIRLNIEEKRPKGEIFDWYWATVETGINVNYSSWCMGYRPRTIKQHFEELLSKEVQDKKLKEKIINIFITAVPNWQKIAK